MNLAAFITARRPAWKEAEALLNEAERQDITSLGHERARRLVDLYRRASADLIQARTYGAGVELVRYLETLVARGYALLYPPPPLRLRRTVGRFFGDRFPRAVRREAKALALVTGAFLGGLVLGGVATRFDPEATRLFVPEEHQRMRPHERVEHDEKAERAGRRLLDAEGHAAFSSFLFTHNIGVSIVCFAIGIAWGLPTLLLIAYQGIIMGALAAEYFRDGVGIFFLAWILPHGVVEMTCMLLAGTAGLLLGRGVLWPRGQPRGDRIREEARAALDILGGTAALLVLAGIVEGTLSQIHEPTLPYPVKIAMALTLGGLLQAYLWLLPLPEADGAPPHQTTPRPFSSK
jgi:uncharacterized membrane protein SpoIIM required for sporulation